VSSDAGNSWKKSEAGLPIQLIRGAGRTASKAPVAVSFMLLVPWQKPFLLATTPGNGVFRSEDNGASWKPASAGLDVTTLFTCAFMGKEHVVLASPETLYNSTDGMTWKKLPINSGRNTIGSLIGVFGHPQQNGLLLIFRFSQDQGNTRRLGYRDPHGILVGLNYGVTPHSEVDSLWIGQVNSNSAIFSSTANFSDIDQVQRDTRPTFMSVSLDGGYSWELVGDTHCGAYGLTPRGRGTGMLIYGRCIQKTDDAGLHWTVLAGIQDWTAREAFNKVEFDPGNKNIFYYCVGVNECHLYRYQYGSGDGNGQSVDLKVLAPDVLVAEDNNKVIFTGSCQLSTDGGWTWVDKSGALANRVQGIRSGYRIPFKLLSFRDGQLLAVVSFKDRFTGSAVVTVLKSLDMGTSWQEVSSLPNQELMSPVESHGGDLMVYQNRDDPSNFFIGTVSYLRNQVEGSKVFETKDACRTWREIYFRKVATYPNGAEDLEYIRGVATVPTAKGRALLVGGNHGLWKSEDEGKTWKRVGGVQ
jgi:photosystem II stability/assembly factor-like uncharacterized protein